MTADELAEAEAWMRARMSETTYAVGGETDARDLWLVMAEYDRMRGHQTNDCAHLDTAIAERDRNRTIAAAATALAERRLDAAQECLEKAAELRKR